MRKSRKTLKKSFGKSVDFSKPLSIPIEKFGSDDDPCFGKLNDAKSPECMNCGDFEFCLIAMSRTLSSKRKEIESSNQFKDLNPTPKIEEISQYMSKLIPKYSKQRIIRLAMKKFVISKEKAKSIISNL